MMNLEQGKNVVAVGTSHELALPGDSPPPGAEEPRLFFSESGAPAPGALAEKPGGFFSGPPAASQPSLTARERGAEPSADAPIDIPPAPWSRGGRPTVLTPEVREQIFKLLAVGMSRRQAGAYLDIDPTTITHAAKRDPEFAQNLQRAEQLGLVQPLMTLMAASKRNWRAAAWLVKHRKEAPEAPTPEQREEWHQERLLQTKRESEISRLRSRLTDEERAEDEARRKAKEDRLRNERHEEMFPRRKKKKAGPRAATEEGK